MNTKKPRQRFSKENWLDLGLVALADEGVRGLTVERICELADKTRGSFYHHFTDHNGFVLALLEHWQHGSTERVIALVRSISDPHMQREALARQVAELSSATENTIRGWAGTDERARQVVRNVDQKRLEFLQLGLVQYAKERGVRLSAKETEDLAVLDYGLFIGVNALKPGAKPDYLLQLSGLSQKMLKVWMDKKATSEPG